jgi:acylglycerol lipase
MERKTQQLTASDGVKLYWQAWEPDGIAEATVCLLHGLGEHAGRYDHVARAFTAKGIAVHAIDLRGHGRSEGPRGHTPSLDQWLDDIRLLIDHANAVKARFLYGHSLGGLLALRFGLRPSTPLAGVIATGPALRRSFEVPPLKLLLGRLMSRVWPTFSQHSGLNPHDLSRDESVVQAYIDDPLVHDWASARLFIEATRAGEETLALAAEFNQPLLLICGQEDRLIDVAACKTFFEGTASEDKTLRILPGLFHEVHNEPEKAAVIEEIVTWVVQRK